MSKYSDEKIDKMLHAYYTCQNETFTYRKKRKTLKYASVIAACLILAVIAGICLYPSLLSKRNDKGFTIVSTTNALTTGNPASTDEITANTYVKFAEFAQGKDINFDFDEILYEDAPDYNVAKKYLFHSFSLVLDISVEGEDIKTVTYKANKGGFNICRFTGDYSDYEEMKENMRNHFHFYYYEGTKNEIDIDYDLQKITQITFCPVFDPDETYENVTLYYSSPNPIVKRHHDFLDTMEYDFSENYNELRNKYGWEQTLARGYRSSAPTVVTDEERAILREYAKNDDMQSFFNYQNQVIFKRILEEVKIDVIITRTDGSKETKTLELMYTPDEITDYEWYLDSWYRKSHGDSHSSGTLSAKIAE